MTLPEFLALISLPNCSRLLYLNIHKRLNFFKDFRKASISFKNKKLKTSLSFFVSLAPHYFIIPVFHPKGFLIVCKEVENVRRIEGPPPFIIASHWLGSCSVRCGNEQANIIIIPTIALPFPNLVYKRGRAATRHGDETSSINFFPFFPGTSQTDRPTT